MLYLLWGNGGPPTMWSERGAQIAYSSVNSFRDIAMYRCWRFGLKFPIHGPFGGVFGAYFPHMTSPIVLNPKGPPLGGNTSFEPFSVKICASVQPGLRIEKIIQDNKKVTNVLYFPYLGGSPHWTDSTKKLHSV